MAAALNVDARLGLLYAFASLQHPRLGLSMEGFRRRLEGMHARARPTLPSWSAFLAQVHVLDAYVAAACLENQTAGWECLFRAPAGRVDRLLIDALRQRAARCFPLDVVRQDESVADFWGHLLVAPREGSVPILQRYDGLRPLVPWLIRVFHNRLISQLRSPHQRVEALAEDDGLSEPPEETPSASRWEETFCEAARAWLADLPDDSLLLLGLLWRCRLSQREVAGLFKVHEGTISRQISKLRDQALDRLEAQMRSAGWTGDDVQAYILREMQSVLLDEARLALPELARLCQRRGLIVPGLASPNGAGTPDRA
ncbi:MAG TPA: sigma-70 family RNA polymerase sigma factor [Gemmatales bacterium]|nr:sigma-70 family RNA polymerase sigma factor [Gemmatales bacterium]HMP59205.1 sigma-70 family RNA polymerase sigma factor [Gemmatales bacterium]